MILVDTSVWVSHFRTGSRRLASLLQDGQVLCHPLVIGALACGSLSSRGKILHLLNVLPKADIAEHHEAMSFLETHRLYARGLGWVDVNLLASAQLSRCALWTTDARLEKAAASLGLAG